MDRTPESTLGSRTVEAVDDKRGAVADGLDRAAEGVRGAADRLPGGGAPRAALHQGAERLKDAAGYVRERSFSDMLRDGQEWVKDNPGPSLLAAGILGFAIGRTLRHD